MGQVQFTKEAAVRAAESATYLFEAIPLPARGGFTDLLDYVVQFTRAAHKAAPAETVIDVTPEPAAEQPAPRPRKNPTAPSIPRRVKKKARG